MNCGEGEEYSSEAAIHLQYSPPPTPTSLQVERPTLLLKKVLRVPALKRNRDNIPLNEKVKLERVLGLTVSGSAALCCDVHSGSIVYPAGCVVVLYNLRKNRQTHLLNASKKTITSLDVSSDGKYVVTGECGHLPNVRIWNIQEKVQVAEFTGHKFGINCVAFSPNLKYVVSVGSQHDMIVNVWDWRSGVKVASNKVSSKVKAVAFSESGNYFVTVGNRHVKFWYLECSSRPSKYKEPVPLMGRSAILGEQRNNYFCDVACGRGDIASSTFSITKSGLLCEFNGRRLLDKWVELRTTSANCLCVGRNLIFIGCSDGIVRCFNPYTIEYVTTLPRTHCLGVEISMGHSISHMAVQRSDARFPDTVAIALDEMAHKVTCVYADHSIYVWDVTDIKKVGKSHSFLYHSACIWGVEIYPSRTDGEMTGGKGAALPNGSFVTCSSDDTIRIWNLDSNLSTSTPYRRNIYSNDLLKIVYVDETLNYLCDLDRNQGGSNDKMDATYDTKNGVRCIRVSPDGQQLASGDRSGNIRIHEMHRMDEVCKIEAHDSEVLNLEYSRPDTGHRLLASASRDRLIHVFDVDQDYAFQQTLDDHSSSITAVRFVRDENRLQMISCGADKSIIFRTAQFLPQLQFVRDHHVVGRTTLYDMEVDVDQLAVLTACQDRHVRVYTVGSGKHARSFKGSLGEDGTLIKVVLDPSGTFAATSCTDKNLCVFEYATGECVATVYGHSELVTGLRFTNDCKYLISVSGDGCIFIWKLPIELTHQMHVRLAQMTPKLRRGVSPPRRSSAQSRSPPARRPSDGFGPAHPHMLDARVNEADVDDGVADYRFSVGPLPKWAKKEIADDLGSSTPSREKLVGVLQPKSRWAQRIDTQGLTVRSFYSSDHVIPYPGQVPSRTSAQPANEDAIRRETIVLSKGRLPQDSPSDFIPCPDSLDEIRRGVTPTSPGPFTGVSTRTNRGISATDISCRRQRLATDSSGTSSPIRGYEMESTEVDGDDEESLETDHSTELDAQEIIYYPQLDEPLHSFDGEFKVCATNQDELRDSHRRFRKGIRAERPSDLTIASAHASDDDEDEVSTPQGTTDRSVMSMLNVSMESLDRVGQREKFLKSNYDSLDGDAADVDESIGHASLPPNLRVNGNNEEEGGHDNGDDEYNRRLSLSARYLHKSGHPSATPRNASNRNSSQSLNERSSPRRQEIMKQIEQTRRKLDTIGYKASMNSSKSIGDLTDIPEKDYYGGVRNGERYFSTNKGANSSHCKPHTSSLLMKRNRKRTYSLPSQELLKEMLSDYNDCDGIGNREDERPQSSASDTTSSSLVIAIGRGDDDNDESSLCESLALSLENATTTNNLTNSSFSSDAIVPENKAQSEFKVIRPCATQLKGNKRLYKNDNITNNKKAQLRNKVAISHLLPSKCSGSDMNANEAIRRASSMNDLSQPRRLLAPPNITVTNTITNKLTSNHVGNIRRSMATESRTSRETRSRAPASSPISRSSSMGTLNPSESDAESGSNASSTMTTTMGASNGTKSTSNLSHWNNGSAMKPTISSKNKAVGYRGSQDALNNNGNSANRISSDKPPGVPWASGGGRRIMGSNVERLRTQFDTRKNGNELSSGECSPTDTKPPTRTTPALSTGTLPRNHGRRMSNTALSLSSSRSRSEKDLSKVGVGAPDGVVVTKGKVAAAVQSFAGRNGSASNGSETNTNMGFMLEKSPQELPVKDNLPQVLDVASAPLGRGLCDWTSQSLKLAADNVLQLYKRVAMDSDLLDSERIEMLNMLCESVSQAQQTLRPVNPDGVGGYLSDHLRHGVGSTVSKGGDGADSSSSATSISSAHWKTDSDGAPSTLPPTDHTHLLQQYSDMLLSIVQQRMGSQT